MSSQLALIDASKKAGTIKRFYPSEYGGYYALSGERGSTFNPYLRQFLESKEVSLYRNYLPSQKLISKQRWALAAAFFTERK